MRNNQLRDINGRFFPCNRVRRLSIRVTPEEHKLFGIMAKHRQFTITAYIVNLMRADAAMIKPKGGD